MYAFMREIAQEELQETGAIVAPGRGTWETIKVERETIFILDSLVQFGFF